MKERKTHVIPKSFNDAFIGHYLGDPAVVTELVATFMSVFEESLRQKESGEIPPVMFVDKCHNLVLYYADIFSGKNPDFKAIDGHHTTTLRAKLKVDLGEFWKKQRSSWGDDPVAVLFEWLAVMIAEKNQRAAGDDDLFGVMIKPSVQYAVRVLLGIEQRVSP